MREIFLCSISNVSSGDCPEDCAYCTQSGHHQGKIRRYKYKKSEEVLEEAKYLHSLGALGFCLVTSGRGLDDQKCAYIANLAQSIKKEVPHLHLIACCGRADIESLKHLKQHGVDSYNHNLETSQKFFPNICTTHTWEERFETCENALRAGLLLCSGGIFGLGESFNDRIDLLRTLQSLTPATTPVNFFIPSPTLPIKEKIMGAEEALECLALAKEFLPKTKLMVAGGREVVFGEKQREIFDCGVDAIVLGDYLTAKGDAPKKDLEMLANYGFAIATSCDV
ncbi:biotin synthase [Helicobacter heilmannii]|uniref:Biotin synthase n=1 Tax=Helicobacter heilmannii TaxID=35817 RepID=A0A0K2Y699_HELHE|nr:biotin synthase [Helicobacter heilmannii]BDQ27807.1 biotin synthase [Helicobacter heilmannii]CCM10962.1 Biotin synthase [Helicobacter heilmannii ASB1.4]CRI33652.1 Biotin synthase [Helicobacter heilmannii]